MEVSEGAPNFSAEQGSTCHPVCTCSPGRAPIPSRLRRPAAVRLEGSRVSRLARESTSQGEQQMHLILIGLRALSEDSTTPLLNMDPIVIVTK